MRSDDAGCRRSVPHRREAPRRPPGAGPALSDALYLAILAVAGRLPVRRAPPPPRRGVLVRRRAAAPRSAAPEFLPPMAGIPRAHALTPWRFCRSSRSENHASTIGAPRRDRRAREAPGLRAADQAEPVESVLWQAGRDHGCHPRPLRDPSAGLPATALTPTSNKSDAAWRGPTDSTSRPRRSCWQRPRRGKPAQVCGRTGAPLRPGTSGMGKRVER